MITAMTESWLTTVDNYKGYGATCDNGILRIRFPPELYSKGDAYYKAYPYLTEGAYFKYEMIKNYKPTAWPGKSMLSGYERAKELSEIEPCSEKELEDFLLGGDRTKNNARNTMG